MLGHFPLASGRSKGSQGKMGITLRRKIRPLNSILAAHDPSKCFGAPKTPTCELTFPPKLLPPTPAGGFDGSSPMQLSSGTSATYENPDIPQDPAPLNGSIPAQEIAPRSATHPLPPWKNPALWIAPGGGSLPVCTPIPTLDESDAPCRISDASDFDPETASRSIVGSWRPQSGKPNDFEEHWIDFKPVGMGSNGYVCLAVRKATSNHYTLGDAGKIYAVKRMLFPADGDSGVNTIHWERYAHALCKQDASWKSMDLFAWMEDSEKNVRYPTWCAFNHIQGLTIDEMHPLFGYFPAPLVLDVLEDLCKATVWLHAETGGKPRMAHADLHSSNVMLDLSRPVPEGRHLHIRILDFGMAQWAGPNDTEQQHLAVTELQHRDIDFIGHIIHNLVCNDRRRLGFHDRYLPNQLTHCHSYSEHGLVSHCPRLTDPNSNLFRNRQDRLWDFIFRGMFMKNGSNLCDEIKDWTMDHVNAYVKPLIAEARAREMSMPHFGSVRDQTISVLKGAVPPHPLLATKNQISPPLPLPMEELPRPASYPLPPSTSVHNGSGPYLPPPAGRVPLLDQVDLHRDHPQDYEYSKTPERFLRGAQKQAAPRIPAKAPERHDLWCTEEMRAALPPVQECVKGKRTHAQMSLDDYAAVEEPLAKRLRTGLVRQPARMDAQDNLQGPYGLFTHIDLDFGPQLPLGILK